VTTKYTPGPWLCEMPDDDGSIFIIGSDLGGLVGAAHCWPTEIDTRGSDRVRANARLIAAAPELLEALRDMVSLFSADGYLTNKAPIGIRHALASARQALARIDG